MRIAKDINKKFKLKVENDLASLWPDAVFYIPTVSN